MAHESVIRDLFSMRSGIIVEEGIRQVARSIADLPLGYYTPRNDHTKKTNQQIICRGKALATPTLWTSGL